jgi:hypothetical protein
MNRVLRFRYGEQSGDEMTYLLRSSIEGHGGVSEHKSYSYKDVSNRALGSLQQIAKCIPINMNQIPSFMLFPRSSDLNLIYLQHIAAFLDQRSKLRLKMVSKSLCYAVCNFPSDSNLLYQHSMDYSTVSSDIRRAADPVRAVMDVESQDIQLRTSDGNTISPMFEMNIRLVLGFVGLTLMYFLLCLLAVIALDISFISIVYITAGVLLVFFVLYYRLFNHFQMLS